MCDSVRLINIYNVSPVIYGIQVARILANAQWKFVTQDLSLIEITLPSESTVGALYFLLTYACIIFHVQQALFLHISYVFNLDCFWHTNPSVWRIPINKPLCASTGHVLDRNCQHRTSTGPVLATNGMFTGIRNIPICSIRFQHGYKIWATDFK